MAIAYDSTSLATATTDPVSWTHTPVGTPRGIIVYVEHTGATDEVVGVTYGGVAMTEVSGSPLVHSAGETSVVHAFFLGASIPTGAQTVSVDVSGASNKRCTAISLTAGADTEVQDADATINSTALANPSVVLSAGGASCFAVIGFNSGQNAPGSITPLTGWTDRGEFDFGAITCGVYTYDTVGTSDVTAGWTQASDDAVMIALAVKETSGASAALTGAGGSGLLGAVVAAVTIALSGVVGTGAVETLGAALMLDGVVATGAVGAPSVDVSIGLTGVFGTGVVGSAGTTNDGSAAVAGVGAVGGVGAVTIGSSPGLTGVTAATVAGTVTPAPAVVVSGVSASGSVGAVAKSVDLPLVGVVGVGTPGAVGIFGLLVPTSGGETDDEAALLLLDVSFPDTLVAITGVGASGAVGVVAPVVAPVLSGVNATGTVSAPGTVRLLPLGGFGTTGLIGTVLTGTDVAVNATGIAATTTVGAVAADNVHPIADGVSAQSALGALVTVPSVSLTGAEASGATGATAPVVSVSITGVAGTVAAGSVGVAKDGSAVLDGVAAVGAVGTVDVGSNVTRPLTDVFASGLVGAALAEVSAPFVGVAAVGVVQAPTVEIAVAVAVAGVAGSGSVGVVAPSSSALQVLPGLIEAGIDDLVFGLGAEVVDDPLGVVLAYD